MTVAEETVFGQRLRHRPLTARTPDGVSIAIQDWAPDGQPREADVLLIHGFSQSHRAWFHQVSAPLAQQFRLVTYDLRGHGASERPTEAAYYRDPSRWADELNAVMEAGGLHRPVLIAWSYGGRIALDYLTRYGDSAIAGLIMANATATSAPEALGPGIGVLRQMVSPDPAIAREGTAALLRACLARPASAAELDYMLSYNEQVPPAVRAHLAGRPADYQTTLARLRVPALVIHGLKDPINTPVMASYTVRQVRHAQSLTYDEAGHMPFWEYPQRFNDDVAQFIRGAVRPARSS